MKRQVLAGAVPPHWWERLKGAQFGFVAGLLVGLLFGWFFHGVISLAVRFGLLLVLLLPLLVIGWLWLRSQRAPGPPVHPPAGADTRWATMIDVERAPSRPAREPESPPLIDVPFARPARESRPIDVEAELEVLQRQRERQRERGT